MLCYAMPSLVGCANRCSEECVLQRRGGYTEDELMELRGRWPEKSRGTKDINVLKYSKS
jgi:hypothetical protein